MAFEPQLESLLLGLLQSVESGDLTANQARESLTRLVSNAQVGSRQLERERFRLGAREQQRRVRLAEQRAVEAERRSAGRAILKQTRDIARFGPSSPMTTAAVARLKELGDPVGAARVEQAAEGRYRRLLEDENKRLVKAGAPLPDNFKQDVKELMQTPAGRARITEQVDEKVAEAKAETRRARLTKRLERGATRHALRLGMEPEKAIAAGESAASMKVKLGRGAYAIPEALGKQAMRGKLVKHGGRAAAAGLGLLLLSKLFGGGKDVANIPSDVQMQMALMAQEQARRGEAGETIQEGRQLRNVSTLLGILKMLQGVQGMQMQAPSMSRIA